MLSIPYNDTLGQGVPANPPYSIFGVTASGFFLRANPVSLAYFIDSYLNIVPPGIAVFRPAAPYVLLMMVDLEAVMSAAALRPSP